MKILILTGALLLTGILSNGLAQNSEENKGSEHYPLMKRVEGSPYNAESSDPIIQSKEKSTDLPDPNNRVINNSGSSESKAAVLKPATRTTSKKAITEINYSLNNHNSTISNLLMLIEIKEKVNESGNSSLLNSKEYQQLLSDINSLRKDFNSSVESKGIENCSTLEQSHYLAFLKEEGKDEAYQEAMKQLK